MCSVKRSQISQCPVQRQSIVSSQCGVRNLSGLRLQVYVKMVIDAGT